MKVEAKRLKDTLFVPWVAIKTPFYTTSRMTTETTVCRPLQTTDLDNRWMLGNFDGRKRYGLWGIL